MKISCFRAKAHPVFHWCLYNNFSCTVQSIQSQGKHFVNFNQLSCTELIIKLMNSQNFSLNSHLLKFISLCNDLRNNLLSNHIDDTNDFIDHLLSYCSFCYYYYYYYYLYMSILTSPEATNCFSIITLMIIRENKIIDQFPTPKHQQILLPF